MKQLLFLLLFPATVFLASGKTASSIRTGPQLVFDSTDFDFGTIRPGDIVFHDYHFTNKGTESLIIFNVSTGCGCLVAQWPKDPVAPGKDGIVRLTFNSAGKQGQQYKAGTISSNSLAPEQERAGNRETATFPAAQRPVMIYMHGKVEAPAGK
jgi:hypothetical protein